MPVRYRFRTISMQKCRAIVTKNAPKVNESHTYTIESKGHFALSQLRESIVIIIHDLLDLLSDPIANLSNTQSDDRSHDIPKNGHQ